MGKRKRQVGGTEPSAVKKTKAIEDEPPAETIQIVAGSYDRVLHGLTATIGQKEEVDFADTFLFNAHASAIRCVAVSPPSAAAAGGTRQKVLLASGSTDERIHVYSISAHPPSRKRQRVPVDVGPRPILENVKNRELGTLLHHGSSVTALRFPTRSKLLSASEDSTMAVTRTRDWSLLSTIKAPKPKAAGRPSGDTAAFGAAPAGVNDFAVHPSLKLMISVSKGEKCMRLWNLVTGKKAGVLGFGKEMLSQVGEGRHATGEARRVVWGGGEEADEFAVGFDRGLVVFGMDSVPRCRVVVQRGKAMVKLHQFGYVSLGQNEEVLAVATEDGRIAFFDTRVEADAEPSESLQSLPAARLVGQVGGPRDGVAGRIKDFVVVPSGASPGTLYVVGASSDGKIRVWLVRMEELRKGDAGEDEERGGDKVVGKLAGTYETHNRITCLAGYLMLARPEGDDDSEEEEEEESEGEEEDDDEDDDDE